MNRVTVLSLTTAALLVVGDSTGLVQRTGLQTIGAALGQTGGQTQQIEPLSANDDFQCRFAFGDVFPLQIAARDLPDKLPGHVH